MKTEGNKNNTVVTWHEETSNISQFIELERASRRIILNRDGFTLSQKDNTLTGVAKTMSGRIIEVVVIWNEKESFGSVKWTLFTDKEEDSNFTQTLNEEWEAAAAILTT